MSNSNSFSNPPSQVRKAAHVILSYAIKTKILTPPEFCEWCNGVTIGRALDGHHLDYSKPLDVIWLCRSCHRIEHQPTQKLSLAIQWLKDNPDKKGMSNRQIGRLLDISHPTIAKARKELLID